MQILDHLSSWVFLKISLAARASIYDISVDSLKYDNFFTYESLAKERTTMHCIALHGNALKGRERRNGYYSKIRQFYK